MVRTFFGETKRSSFLEEIPIEGKARYQLLCVHGLNQNPESLKPLLNDLARQGLRCFLLHLPGHSPVDSDCSDVNKDIIFSAYCNAYQSIKKEYDEPLGFLGYSFGGLIGATMLDQCPYDKVSLLAPALKLRSYTHGIRHLLPYLSRIASIPLGSATYEKHYRFHQNGVPREIYKSFFDIYDEFHCRIPQVLQKTQGLIFTHPKDELISFKGLEQWVKENSHWSLHALSNKEADFSRYHHLVFDQTTLGPNSYTNLLNQMTGFFLES